MAIDANFSLEETLLDFGSNPRLCALKPRHELHHLSRCGKCLGWHSYMMHNKSEQAEGKTHR